MKHLNRELGAIKHPIYYEIYEKEFSHYQNSAEKILEFGVFEGNSLLMWEEYFSKSKIHGVDVIEEKYYSKQIEGKDRIQVHIGNYTNLDFLNTLGEEYDIIIDDCGHIAEQTMKCFLDMWPKIKMGGCYAIEDLFACYAECSNGNISGKGMTSILKEVVDQLLYVPINTPKLYRPWVETTTDYTDGIKNLSHVSIYNTICFFYKSKTTTMVS